MIKDPSKLGRAGQRFFQILSVSPLRYIMPVSTFPSIFQKIWWAVNSASLCCPAPSKVILRIKKLKNRENHESECHSPQRPHFGAENAACRGSDPGFISRPRFEYAIANAEHNQGADIDDLKIQCICVDKAKSFKRSRARAKGRGHRIEKQTCHIAVTVGD